MSQVDFTSHFQTLTRHSPFCWQRRLFDGFLDGMIPDALDLPTGLGKTSVMAVWLLARLAGAPVPRRLVYVVDRRAVVDQATETAITLRSRVGAAFDRSLAISTLRGQYADNRAWLADPAGAAIVVGTVDMIGSRLLFSGYGVGAGMRPYQAGLLGTDTLVLLDEAHLVPPFAALLQSITRLRNNAPDASDEAPLVPPLRLLPMSATGLPHTGQTFRLTPGEAEERLPKARLTAAKHLYLHDPVEHADLPGRLADLAWTCGTEPPARVLVYCNSRTQAEDVARLLTKRAEGDRKTDTPAVEIKGPALLVGARRVRERERAFRTLVSLGFLPPPAIIDPEDGEDTSQTDHDAPKPTFLVATSAGEVGVDLDADHLVGDLVAWERMVQRLGRVNRRGGEDRRARVEIVPALPKDKKQAAEFNDRLALLRAPIEALPRLDDGGFDACPAALDVLNTSSPGKELARAAETPAPSHPALTRALVDAWSQTRLDHHPGRPDIDPWLRGWDTERPQTLVIWRRWLPWPVGARVPVKVEVEDHFAIARPHLLETLETETNRVFDWLAGRIKALTKALAAATDARLAPMEQATPAALVLDRSGRLHFAYTLSALEQFTAQKGPDKQKALAWLAGKTVVVAAGLGGLSQNGLLDTGEGAAPKTVDDGFADSEIATAIGYRIVGPGDPIPEDSAWKRAHSLTISPAEESEQGEARMLTVYVTRGTPGSGREGDHAIARREQTLDDHSQAVVRAAEDIADGLALPPAYRAVLVFAARHHDQGKARRLWQDAMGAPRQDRPYAKTAGTSGRALNGYRHEFGSLIDLVDQPAPDGMTPDLYDLALHLIAAHHGYGRPVMPSFVPETRLTVRETVARDVALRFARLQRHWGPWGLAWWEALLRAADQQASRQWDLNSAGKGT